MKHSNFNLLVLMALTLLFVACGNQSKKNTSATTNKVEISKEGEHKTIFENEYAKVIEVSLAPGESIQPHSGEERVIYSLTNYAIDWEEQGENLGIKSMEKG
jgi:predicted component of type VI protein secretion system